VQYELIFLNQINQAGVAFEKVPDKEDDFVQSVFQHQLPNHQPADSLEEPKLLFGALKSSFEIACPGHRGYYAKAAAKAEAVGRNAIIFGVLR
jgi:hypothetical protein